MRLRSIAVTLMSLVAGVTLVSGFSPGPAQARPAPASAAIATSAIGASTGRASVGSGRTAALARLAARQASQGVITGVVDGAAGRPLTGVCVIASGPSGNVKAITLANGRYVLAALRPGGYTLHFSACAAGGGYVDQWSGGASWPEHASVVTVAAGQVRQVGPVTLRRTPTAPPVAPADHVPASATSFVRASATITASTGGIAGTVTGNGKPLTGVCVNAFGPGHGTALTSKTGQYQIGGLQPGRYEVEFIAGQFDYCGKNTGNWLTQWYRGVTGLNPPAHPVRVLVTAGKVTRGIDAAMRLGGEITGTTRSKSGKALAGVCVNIDGQLGHIGFASEAISGKNGSYAAHSLFKGKYFVQFSPGCGSKGNYAPQWYKDSANQAHAKAIEITGTEVVRHVDAALPPGGVITGVVKSQVTNAPVKGICAVATPQSRTGGVFRFARTSANGDYRITGLITGKYVVEFNRGCGNEGNYLPVHRVVSVRTSHTVKLSASMPPGAIVSGVVTDSHGNPVSGVCVQAFNNHSFNAAKSGADGSYSVDALPSGSYTVQFNGGCGNADSYATQFYQGQVNAGSANPVALTAGETTPGIDAAMAPGGAITGLVTGAGHPLKACVMVTGLSDLNSEFPVNLEFTTDGTYLASNLTPGLYAVDFGCFFGPRPFAGQWYKSRISASSADLVSAPPGVITSDIGAALPRDGFISGMVTNSAHVKLSDICVTATPPGSNISAAKFGLFSVTDHGAYRIGPLSPGSYDVQFTACVDRQYATQWYHGSVTQQAATPVRVRFGATTSGINAVMTSGGSISGLVTNGAHQPLPRICVTATDAAAQSTEYGATDNTGHYTIPHLATGEYQVTFASCLSGKRAVAGSVVRSVHVTAPHAVVGFNEKMAPAGIISGTVLGGGAATPQAGVCVVAVPVSPSDAIGSTTTNDQGKYQVTNLAPGAYRMYFGDPFCPFSGTGYAPKTMAPVTLPAGGDVGGVNATLASDGAISGTVTQGSHTPVAGECVTAVPVSPTPDPLFGDTLHHVVAQTTADGSYTLVGLLPGQYKVEFSTGCGDSGFQTQWWNDAASAAAATTITVSADATVQHIDATLQP